MFNMHVCFFSSTHRVKFLHTGKKSTLNTAQHNQRKENNIPYTECVCVCVHSIVYTVQCTRYGVQSLYNNQMKIANPSIIYVQL